MRRLPSPQLLAVAVSLFVANTVACAMPGGDSAEPVPSSEELAPASPSAPTSGEGASEPSTGSTGGVLGEPPVAPPSEQRCDGVDDNGNGVVDEGCACAVGETRACYGGPAITRRVGTCADGQQTCEGTEAWAVWSDCVGDVGPTADIEDGLDNDCDGEADNAPKCGPDQNAVPERCTNGEDDDCDGLADCLDPDCSTEPNCAENCTDGVDNDGDGMIDCADAACAGGPSCQEVCHDGVDNDGDGQIDCADTDCSGGPGCHEECNDGLDNDGNALVDCQDPACAAAPNCQEVCHDGVDNDGDGMIDCQDPDCSNDVGCKSDECSAGGTVYVNNLWYCSLGTDAYGVHLWSGMAWGMNQACGADFGTGGTFTAKCAGTYDVCARVVANANNCTLTTQCVTVFVPTDNGTVNLPPFPGFANVTGACANATYPYGGKTCIDVSGTTVDNIPVSKNDIVCLAEFSWGGGTGGDSGGGSY